MVHTCYTLGYRAFAGTMKINSLIIGTLLLLTVYNCTPTSNESSKKRATANTRQWYEGGTLHQAKIADWRKSTDENKLATCADFASLDKSVNMEILKQRAIDLRACINEATNGLTETDNMDVSEVAAMCTVILGYD